jgi:hypothetical protein
MMQALHIFAKDVRRFWPEILISLAVTAAFARVYPNMWMPEFPYGGGRDAFAHHRQLTIMAYVLIVLMPISWWLLITRVVHAESLVGDKQFWVTRPYEWPKLLAAKLLFVGLFVVAPFTAALEALLVEGGFRLWWNMPGLLFNLLLCLGALIVPLFTLAVVTKNFARMTLTLLAMLLLVVGIAFLSSLSEGDGVSVPYGDRYSLPVLLLACGCAIGLQYAGRKVWIARGLLLAVVPAIIVVAVMFPTQAMVDTAYPRAARPADAPMQFAVPPVEAKQPMVFRAGNKADLIEVVIPVTSEGVLPSRAVLVEDVKMVAVGPQGEQWSSPWTSVYNMRYLAGNYDSRFVIKMKRADFARFHAKTARVTLVFAMTEVWSGPSVETVLTSKPKLIPGLGVCMTERPSWSISGEQNLACRNAFGVTELTYVKTAEYSGPCGGLNSSENSEEGKNRDVSEDDGEDSKTDNVDPRETPKPIIMADWVGSVQPDPADFGLTSVWSVGLNLKPLNGEPQRSYLCPNTPVTFTRYHLARRVRTELSIPDFHFAESVPEAASN